MQFQLLPSSVFVDQVSGINGFASFDRAGVPLVTWRQGWGNKLKLSAYEAAGVTLGLSSDNQTEAGSGDAVVNSTCEFLVSSELNTNTYTDGIIGACGYFVYLSFYVPNYSGNPIIILTTTPPISSQAGSLKHIHVYHFIKKTTTNIF